MCSSRSKEGAGTLGYTSAVAVARAANTWLAMHAWSLRAIAEAFAHTEGGVDRHLENKRAMVFVLLPRKFNRAHDFDNPATTFVLEQGSLADKDERAFLRVEWPTLEVTCKRMAHAMRAKLTAMERRAFAGFISATFHFKGTGRGWSCFTIPSTGYRRTGAAHPMKTDSPERRTCCLTTSCGSAECWPIMDLCFKVETLTDHSRRLASVCDLRSLGYGCPRTPGSGMPAAQLVRHLNIKPACLQARLMDGTTSSSCDETFSESHPPRF